MTFVRYSLCLCLAWTALSGCGQKAPVVPPDPGSLIVVSDPPGASVQINGRPAVGPSGQAVVTPDTLELAPGTYRVSVWLDGYGGTPQTEDAVVTSSEPTVAAFCLRLTSALTARVVLVEHFSNVDCPPCGPAEVVLNEFQESTGYDRVISIGYRTSFPWSRDPLRLENPAVHDGRAAYYNIPSAPTVVLDGTLRRSDELLDPPEDLFAAAESVPAGFSIDVTSALDGQTYSARATVVALECPQADDLVIHFALVEREVSVLSSLGVERLVHNVVRDMLPGVSGQAFSAAFGETLTFERQRVLDPGWAAGEIETIVFIQSESTQEILQSASTFVATP